MSFMRQMLVLAGLVFVLRAWAQDGVVIAPETDHVDITTNFAGVDVKVFGAIDTPADLILRVIGPSQDVTLSREVKHGPFWLGGGEANVTGAPSLLYLYATKPIASLLPAAVRTKYGLELEAVPLQIEPHAGGISPERWRRAFFRLKERSHAYVEDDHAIKITRDRLIASDISLPAEVGLGTHRIEALLVRDGKVVAYDRSEFDVRQVGIGAWLWRAAHNHEWLFGVACTLSAMLLGLALNAALHRHQ